MDFLLGSTPQHKIAVDLELEMSGLNVRQL